MSVPSTRSRDVWANLHAHERCGAVPAARHDSLAMADVINDFGSNYAIWDIH